MLASQATSGFEITFCQLWPAIGQTGIGASGPMLIFTNSGKILAFNIPAFGWIPLPLKNPGGSTVAFDTFSISLLKIQYLYFNSYFYLSSNSLFFSSVGLFLLSSLYLSKCSLIGVKSNSYNDITYRSYTIVKYHIIVLDQTIPRIPVQSSLILFSFLQKLILSLKPTNCKLLLIQESTPMVSPIVNQFHPI
jgi:hypothetical protein